MVESRRVAKIRFPNIKAARDYLPPTGMDFQVVKFDNKTDNTIKEFNEFHKDSYHKRLEMEQEGKEVEAICHFIVNSEYAYAPSRRYKEDIDAELSKLKVIEEGKAMQHLKEIEDAKKGQEGGKFTHQATMLANPFLDKDGFDYLRSRVKNISHTKMSKDDIIAANEQLDLEGIEENKLLHPDKDAVNKTPEMGNDGIKRWKFECGELRD